MAAVAARQPVADFATSVWWYRARPGRWRGDSRCPQNLATPDGCWRSLRSDGARPKRSRPTFRRITNFATCGSDAGQRRTAARPRIKRADGTKLRSLHWVPLSR